MVTPEQHLHANIPPAREADAAALCDVFDDAVENGLETFDTTLRSGA